MDPIKWRAAAFLGHPPARAALGEKAPPLISLQSMHFGGTRHWRETIRCVDHQAAANAAIEIAHLVWDRFLATSPTNKPLIDLAQAAMQELDAWQQNPSSTADFDHCNALYLRFMSHRFSSDEDLHLWWVLMKVWNTTEINLFVKRRYGRYLGEVTELANLWYQFSETTLCEIVVRHMIPYLID
ncbi:MAG: hypothetical protein U0670_11890 [Anaerolineae bacterium]